MNKSNNVLRHDHRQRKRFENIDVLRGIVMILMCIDHARDYTGVFPTDPMTLSETPLWLYVLRVLAHLCAPTFIFLSGISAGIVGTRKSKGELSKHLISRGAILCLLEITLVNWGWSFNPLYNTIYLQVIWAIGISMMLLGVALHLRKWMLAVVAFSILGFHNLFSGVHFDCPALHYGWSFILQKNLLPIGEEMMVRTTYPVLPVFAVMTFGYLISVWFTAAGEEQRRKNLLRLSCGMIITFLTLRLAVGYGDPFPLDWNNFVLSLGNLTKYPLSLNFVLLYLAPAIIFLAISERWKFSEYNLLMTLGRVPMFFYILHLYLLHLIILVWLICNEYTLDFTTSLGAVPSGIGYPAWWLWWIIPVVSIAMYLPCRWYYRLKSSHKYLWTRYV